MQGVDQTGNGGWSRIAEVGGVALFEDRRILGIPILGGTGGTRGTAGLLSSAFSIGRSLANGGFCLPCWDEFEGFRDRVRELPSLFDTAGQASSATRPEFIFLIPTIGATSSMAHDQLQMETHLAFIFLRRISLLYNNDVVVLWNCHLRSEGRWILIVHNHIP